MTVLLVDDQISILSGLISGLDWEALEITSIRTADNAQRAKEILTCEPVDVMLCDIEMPGENGLSLLRWARSRKLDFVCVFLTSHADFLYAKEAIQLNCFDYILQPARYEEIQSTVAKAINRVKASSAKKEFVQYGIVAKNQLSGIFQNFFSDWIVGRTLPIDILCSTLHRLGFTIQENNYCFVACCHLLRWRSNPWSTQEWTYAVNNLINEVYGQIPCNILPFSIDHTTFGWVIYEKTNSAIDKGNRLTPLQTTHHFLSEHFPCDFAFYVTPICPLKEINLYSGSIQKTKEKNILLESGVFPIEENNLFSLNNLFDISQLQRWENLLTEYRGEFVFYNFVNY